MIYLNFTFYIVRHMYIQDNSIHEALSVDNSLQSPWKYVLHFFSPLIGVGVVASSVVSEVAAVVVNSKHKKMSLHS